MSYFGSMFFAYLAVATFIGFGQTYLGMRRYGLPFWPLGRDLLVVWIGGLLSFYTILYFFVER